MKKVAVVVGVLFLVVLVGMFVVGSLVMSSRPVYDPYSYPTPVVRPPSPEWQAFQDAAGKGESGYVELQDMMTAPDNAVAFEAGLTLFKSTQKGREMFFVKLPEVDAAVKEHLRNEAFFEQHFELARQAVAGPEGAIRDGAALFLRLPYSRQSLNSGVVGRIGDTLVETIPGAAGDYRVDLAFTIAQYPPSSLDGLKKHLGSSEAEVRLLAVQSLGKLADEASLGEVKRMRSDRAADVRDAAYVAVASIEKAENLRVLAASRTAPTGEIASGSSTRSATNTAAC